MAVRYRGTGNHLLTAGLRPRPPFLPTGVNATKRAPFRPRRPTHGTKTGVQGQRPCANEAIASDET